jgi:hypothetical protein
MIWSSARMSRFELIDCTGLFFSSSVHELWAKKKNHSVFRTEADFELCCIRF